MDIKTKMKVKIGIDLGMTVLLLLLMSYQVTGQRLHEWFGSGLLVMLIAHNILNVRWYKNLWKGNLLQASIHSQKNVRERGNFNPIRLLKAVVNVAALADILLLGYSGIVMSRHLFAFLPIHRGMAVSRMIHLAGSYWGFVLMGIHLGLHWNMVAGICRKLSGWKRVSGFFWLMRLAALAIAGYGAACFVQMDIPSYLFLIAEFAFFDFGKNILLIFAENFAMLGLWVFLGYYLEKIPGRVSAKKLNRKENACEED